MSILFLISLLYLVSFSTTKFEDRKNRYAVKVNTTYKEKIESTLEGYGFSSLNEITPSTIIIEYRGHGQGFKILKTLAFVYPDQIVSWEPVRVYVNELKPAQTYSLSKSLLSSKEGPELSVEDVGQYGYTGKGITIAISDVAINTDQLDLEDHINRKLSYNFVGQTSNVSTNSFEEEKNNDNNVEYTVASERGSGFCTTGIAYNASIAALKIYEIQPKRNRSELQPNYWTASDTLSRSLVYKLDEIYIFVNTWSPANPFEPLDLPMYEAIEYGAREGRRGLGTIYLVPAGSAGNGLSNNIHTITVGSIGQFGSLLYNAYIVVDASVITSGISDGTSFTSSSSVAATYKNKCISRFKGLSVALAQVAGIIALGLEANRTLSLRDVQHLLVKASDHRGLLETPAFKQNAAGKMFHSVFGFGLLNASKFVDLARHKLFLPTLLSSRPIFVKTRELSAQYSDVEFSHRCAIKTNEECVTVVEQAHVSLNLETNTTNLKVVIISPAGTESVLMDEKQPPRVINGKFVTSHFWEEFSDGEWKIRISREDFAFIHIKNVSITLFGIYRRLKQPQRVNGEDSTNNVYNIVTENDTNNFTAHTFAIAVAVAFILLIVIILLSMKRFVKQHKKQTEQESDDRLKENDDKLPEENHNNMPMIKTIHIKDVDSHTQNEIFLKSDTTCNNKVVQAELPDVSNRSLPMAKMKENVNGELEFLIGKFKKEKDQEEVENEQFKRLVSHRKI